MRPREQIETEVRAACGAQDLGRAAALILRGYGPEILGYLMAVVRNEDVAAEVFSTFAEDLWRGIGRFRWDSSARTWAYALARHALHRFLRGPQRRAARNVPLSRAPEISSIEAAVRERTLPHLRTDVKDRMGEIRGQLDPADLEVLILRVDRRMSWMEIARVTNEEQLGAAELGRRAAALRKRFERIKARLRELARKEGLLDDP